jgi:diadenylate cyclase
VIGAGLLSLSVVDIPFIEHIEPLQARDFISAAIEIALLTWLFYVVLKFLHGTRGLAVMKGVAIIILGVFFALTLMVEFFGLRFPRLEAAGGVLLPIIGVVLVILFQPELRTGFTRLSERARLLRGEAPKQLAEFTAAIQALAAQQTGALVIFEQRTGLKTIEATGVPLDSELSGPLIQAIFFPKSPLHDGAVVVRTGRIVAASSMLPLSDSPSVTLEMGTRHRAALSVTEETDAIAVVVSEETGRISVAHRGVLFPMASSESLIEQLTDHLEGYDGELQPA